jgi:hypothetical protein
MNKNNFTYAERNIGEKSDNLIIYFAGPVKISISGWNDQINLSITNVKWNFLMMECLEIAKEAWEIRDNQITIRAKEITIEYNFENLKLYIEHNIVFM